MTSDCTYCKKQIGFPDEFTCKFCHHKFCSKHIQLEKHECDIVSPSKYIRKTWLRKYGQNISTGRYTVVCDECSYISPNPLFIEIANEEREKHIETKGCSEKKVFLEEGGKFSDPLGT